MARQERFRGFGACSRRRRFHKGAFALALAAPLVSLALLVAALSPAAAQTRLVEIGENKVGAIRVTQGKSQTTLGFVDLVVGDPRLPT
jgi:hypothetical protein